VYLCSQCGHCAVPSRMCFIFSPRIVRARRPRHSYSVRAWAAVVAYVFVRADRSGSSRTGRSGGGRERAGRVYLRGPRACGNPWPLCCMTMCIIWRRVRWVLYRGAGQSRGWQYNIVYSIRRTRQNWWLDFGQGKKKIINTEPVPDAPLR